MSADTQRLNPTQDFNQLRNKVEKNNCVVLDLNQKCLKLEFELQIIEKLKIDLQNLWESLSGQKHLTARAEQALTLFLLPPLFLSQTQRILRDLTVRLQTLYFPIFTGGQSLRHEHNNLRGVS